MYKTLMHSPHLCAQYLCDKQSCVKRSREGQRRKGQSSKIHIRVGALSIATDETGDAVVEAAILFPIMIMIFAALVLLAIYLPTRAALQRATQFAATALATEKSDSWLFFNESTMAYEWATEKKQLDNVYVALFSGIGNAASRGEIITEKAEKGGVSSKAGKLTITCDMINNIVYKEIVITATREFTMPVNLSFIGFPRTIDITVTSTAVVQNGDEFIRNMDIAVDFIEYIAKKFHMEKVGDIFSTIKDKASSFLGW